MTAGALAAQADALLAAAAFIEQAGTPGLTIAVDGGKITILVPRTLTPAARIKAVTDLASVIGAPAPVCTPAGTWIQVTADGTIGGHPARVAASIEPEDTAA